MRDDEDFVVLRATIGARMQAGQSADGIARELWKQGYRAGHLAAIKALRQEKDREIEGLKAERDHERSERANLLKKKSEHDERGWQPK